MESTLLEYFKAAGVKPDLLLIFVVFWALFHGRAQGAKLGFVTGLLEDLFLGKYIGLNALTKMIVGYLVGTVENKFFKENLFIPVCALFFATIINSFFYLIAAQLAGIERNLSIFVWESTLPTAIYNTCLAPLLYGKFYKSATKGYLRLGRR